MASKTVIRSIKQDNFGSFKEYPVDVCGSQTPLVRLLVFNEGNAAVITEIGFSFPPRRL